MLRIKKEVDLEILETFGFQPEYYQDTILCYRFRARNGMKSENVYVETFPTTYKIYGEGETFAEKLYDLIQAGLVEKITEPNMG